MLVENINRHGTEDDKKEGLRHEVLVESSLFFSQGFILQTLNQTGEVTFQHGG